MVCEEVLGEGAEQFTSQVVEIHVMIEIEWNAGNQSWDGSREVFDPPLIDGVAVRSDRWVPVTLIKG